MKKGLVYSQRKMRRNEKFSSLVLEEKYEEEGQNYNA